MGYTPSADPDQRSRLPDASHQRRAELGYARVSLHGLRPSQVWPASPQASVPTREAKVAPWDGEAGLSAPRATCHRRLMSTCAEEGAILCLDRAEALVLFDLLARWTALGGVQPAHPVPAACFESPSEPGVLLQLLAQLEKRLVEPFGPDSRQLIDQAREQVAERWPDASL
jgi:hypothetical protein